LEIGTGFLMQCSNELILISCGLVGKNRNYHFVHMGYVLQGIAVAVSILINPAFYVE